MTFRVYFSAAQLYSHLGGDGVSTLCDVYVSHSSREPHIYIIVEGRKKERERDREKGRSEEDKIQGGNQRGGSSMTEIRNRRR